MLHVDTVGILEEEQMVQKQCWWFHTSRELNSNVLLCHFLSSKGQGGEWGKYGEKKAHGLK